MMKYIIIAIFTFTFLGCTYSQKQNTVITSELESAVVELISIEYFNKLDDNIQLIDVRTPEEFQEGFINNAKNINLFDDEFLEKILKLNKSTPVYVYCKSGARSAKAASKLKEAGFTKVNDLVGGITKFISKGHKLSYNR